MNIVKSNGKNFLLAYYWVLAYGTDCDGCNSGHVYAFNDRTEAEEFLTIVQEGSDGIQYGLTDSMLELQRYCREFNFDYRDYLKA